MGQTPADHKKSRVQKSSRYFDKEVSAKDEIVKDDSEAVSGILENSEMEAKRKRLLRKIELAKQGWTGVSVVPVIDEDAAADDDKLDDSGPYEKIATDDDEEDEGTTRSRPPIGQLGDFISLAGYSSEDEELHTDHRLI